MARWNENDDPVKWKQREDYLRARAVIRHRKPIERPFTVWEGTEWSARGTSYRWRWQAVAAAWWVSRYTRQSVWIERAMPRITTPADTTGEQQ